MAERDGSAVCWAARTAGDAAYWLAQAAPAWRDAIEVVAMDMCSICASAVRRMLPGAVIAADLFHVVELAVKMTGDVRRRVTRSDLRTGIGHSSAGHRW